MVRNLLEWIKVCFTALPENLCFDGSKFIKKVLSFEELQTAFVHFETNVKTGKLSNATAWLEDEVPPSILRTRTSSPGWNKDCIAPFVRKLQVQCDQRIVFMGDLHGSIHSLLRNLLRLLSMNILDSTWRICDPKFLLFFLGDFVDRGAYGLEVWFTVMTLIAHNPDRVVLCRGNHEEHSTWSTYQFNLEISRKLTGKGIDPSNGLLDEDNVAKKMFSIFNDKLPHAVYVGWKEQSTEHFIQCSHGGIEPRFDPRPLLMDQSGKEYALTGRYFYGLTWSDFTGLQHPETARHAYTPNLTRGGDSGFLADIPDTQKYMDTYGLRAFFRGHQDDESSFKLVRAGHPWVVPWNALGYSAENLYTGLVIGDFEQSNETVPVFTFSTAVEGRRCLNDEGFGILYLQPKLEDSLLFVYVHSVKRVENERYVVCQETKTDPLNNWRETFLRALPKSAEPEISEKLLKGAFQDPEAFLLETGTTRTGVRLRSLFDQLKQKIVFEFSWASLPSDSFPDRFKE